MKALLRSEPKHYNPLTAKGDAMDRNLFRILMPISGLLMLAFLFAGFTTPAPAPGYTGDVTITKTSISGFACSAHFIRADGTKGSEWLGKPASKCRSIHEGPAKMKDGDLVGSTLRD